MLEKLKNKAWYIAYNDKYIAYIGNTTKVFNRKNQKEETISIKSRNAFWGEFISADELIVKSTHGIYYFINLSSLTFTKVKPKAYINPDTKPSIDIESKVIYDFIDKDCVSTLARINYDGTYKKLFTLPVYGNTNIYSMNGNKIIITNKRGVNEIKDKNLNEIRRYEYDLKEEKMLDEKVNVTSLRPLYFGDDFILYRNGDISDYNGNMSEKSYIPKCFEEGYPNIIYYVKRIEGSKIFISNSGDFWLLDMENEDFSVKLPISNVVNVIHYENKLMFCTWENVYSIGYNEVYST